MSWLNPAMWDNIGVVGIAVAVCFGIVFAVVRGYLVPRSLHREIVDGKNAALKDLRERGVEDAKTIMVQAQTIANKNAVEALAIRLSEATRNAAGGE